MRSADRITGLENMQVYFSPQENFPENAGNSRNGSRHVSGVAVRRTVQVLVYIKVPSAPISDYVVVFKLVLWAFRR